ncbi:MAG TPA: hypothetical protein PK951_04085 [Chitinophagaceae bacterium]|nr:hypothetical protein [Chitinophagaceae bacterium]
MKKTFWKTIAWSGLLVGSLDILSALTHYYIKTGKDPLNVLKYITSAVFGSDAYESEPDMTIYGLLFHYLVAFCWTILFFIIYPRLKLFAFNRVITGIIYGIIIWVVMTKVVVPLSRAVTGPFDPLQAGIAVSILIVAIGLPLSFIAYRFYKR